MKDDNKYDDEYTRGEGEYTEDPEEENYYVNPLDREPSGIMGRLGSLRERFAVWEDGLSRQNLSTIAKVLAVIAGIIAIINAINVYKNW